MDSRMPRNPHAYALGPPEANVLLPPSFLTNFESHIALGPSATAVHLQAS